MENIQSKNRAIALFMGLGIGSIIPYDSSWDFLMEAVDKIASMGRDIIISNERCRIEESVFEISAMTEAKTRILAVHEAVYQFITQLEK